MTTMIGAGPTRSRNPAQGREPVHAGQPDVEHHGVDPAAAGDLEALFG